MLLLPPQHFGRNRWHCDQRCFQLTQSACGEDQGKDEAAAGKAVLGATGTDGVGKTIVFDTNGMLTYGGLGEKGVGIDFAGKKLLGITVYATLA